MTAEVLIVHAIDTEGPLYETLEAKFERLEHQFGLRLPPSRELLERLKAGLEDLGGREQAVGQMLNGHLANYNETWEAVDRMLDDIMSQRFRLSRPDSFGQGWVFTWFCMDHVGFEINPRRRDMGFHNIFDHYTRRLARDSQCRDKLQFHFHPLSTYREAHRCATHYFRDPILFEILARKVIERGFFPSAYRAGFQTERPDSHWFLEQWIPFDISNMALDDNSELDLSLDFKNGRSGDWRGAPSDWSVYHPGHDDYRKPGQCRRWIGRALNVLNRLASIDQAEMDKAFARAQSGQTALVGIASHDWRNMATEVEFLRDLIDRSRRRYPDVKVRFCDAVDGFRRALDMDAGQPVLDLDLVFHPAANGDVASIEVTTKAGGVFGPQPFLAIETRGRRFLHDNFDFSPCGRKWFYAFHGDTLPFEDVARIGVAAADSLGNTCVRKLDFTS